MNKPHEQQQKNNEKNDTQPRNPEQGQNHPKDDVKVGKDQGKQ